LFFFTAGSSLGPTYAYNRKKRCTVIVLSERLGERTVLVRLMCEQVQKLPHSDGRNSTGRRKREREEEPSKSPKDAKDDDDDNDGGDGDSDGDGGGDAAQAERLAKET